MPDQQPQALIYPEDSDIQEGAIRVSTPKPRAKLPPDYTKDGKYIPASGGTRGWFENSGVPVVEHPNRYRFNEAIDEQAFRQSSLDRIQESHRRSAKRFQVALPVRIRIGAAGEEQPGFCVDVSLNGAKLRVRSELAPGTVLRVVFCSPRERGGVSDELFTVTATVRWCSLATTARNTVRYFTGMEFEPMDLPTKEAMAKLVG